MDVLDFGSDWGLPRFKPWNQTDNMIPRPCEERHTEYSNLNSSKRRKLNPVADSLQEEAWLDWLDGSCSSPETENELLVEEAKYGLPSVTKQNEELNDEQKDNLNNLMKYLLDPEVKECEETINVYSDETLGDHEPVGRPTSDLEMQLHDIMAYLLEPNGIENQEVDVSSSKSNEKHSLSSSTTSAELQIEDPQTPETISGNTEERGSDQVLEEFSDSDSEDVMILDLENGKKQPEGLQRVGSSDADGAVTAKDNKWEELQISRGSHPASPASSEETDVFHCYSPQTEEDYNAASLVHLLTACAEAVTSGNQDLAAVILARIEHLVSSKESTFYRVASYFYQSLQSAISQELPYDNIAPSAETIIGAFQLLHEVSPYNKFAHLTANQAIMEAVEDETVVHIIDFDIMEGLQWPPLIEALATRSNEVNFLRITAVQLEGTSNALSSSLELTGRRLSQFAEALKIPFSFETVVLDEETASLDLDGADQGGALIANCMLQLPHMTSRNPKSIFSFISAVSKMEAKLVTISDDALKCRSADFTERFFEILHHSCALFDSLEASLSMHSLARATVETTFLAPRIWSTVSSICQQEEKDQEVGRGKSGSSWIMQELGFVPVIMSDYNQIQADLLLAFFKEGYGIEEKGHELAISWGDRPLVAVSTWTCSAKIYI